MKLKLTDRAINALAIPAAGRVYHQDAALPGLALCVTANGCRTFYRVGRVAGKPAFIRLGAYPALTVTGARRAAAIVNGRIACGENPAEERRKPADPTLAEMFDHWLNEYARQHRKHWEVDKRRFTRLCKPLAGLTASLVTRTAIASLHRDIGEVNGQATANHVLSLLSGVFSFAGNGPNPCKGVKRFKSHSRSRFLTDAEVAPFFRALAAESEDWRDYFSLLLYSGVRRSNLAAARWEQFDLANRLWVVPHTKNGEPVTVHLSEPAAAILTRRAAGGGELVFPAIGCPKNAWKRITKAAGIVGLVPHDLRRSLAHLLADDNTSSSIIAKMLGHSSLSTVQVYARLSMKPVAEAVDRAAAKILSLAVTAEAHHA